MAKRKNEASGPVSGCSRQETRYTRGQVLASARYRDRRDLVSALLDDGRTYTIAEVDQEVDRFIKGKVK